MTEVVITDEFVNSLFDHPKFIQRIRRVQDTEQFQKINELTKSDCSQMETSTNQGIDSELIVQQISILLLENMNKKIVEQLQHHNFLSNWFFKQIKQIKQQLNMVVECTDQQNQLRQNLRKMNSRNKKIQSQNIDNILTKKQHKQWAKDLIDQINGCINSGMITIEQKCKNYVLDLERKIDGKVQKNFRTINDLHNIIQPKQKKVDLKIINQKQVKITREKQEIQHKQKNKQKEQEKDGQRKLQLSKSLQSLGNFFRIKK